MALFNRRTFVSSALATAGSSTLIRRLGMAQSASSTTPEPTSPLVLWYEKPATQWVEALPIGNGSLGAMVYGGGEDSAP
jgi:alpha-L-fucosidase 2